MLSTFGAWVNPEIHQNLSVEVALGRAFRHSFLEYRNEHVGQ